MDDPGCPGCWQSARGQAMALEEAVKKAKQYAKEKYTTVAIIQEGYEYSFFEARYAITQFAGRPMQFISQYS